MSVRAEVFPTAVSASVDENLSRGGRIAQRRQALGIRSVREFSSRAGVSREAVKAAEQDSASPGTYRKLEAWLSEQEGPGAEPAVGDQIEFDVTGPRTEWHLIVRGPAEIADSLRRQVVELLREVDPGD